MRDPREAARVGAHARECDACAAAVEAHMAPRIDSVVDSATNVGRVLKPARIGGLESPPYVAWLAAAAVIAAVVALILLRRPPSIEPKPVLAPIRVAPTPAVDTRWDPLLRQALDGTLPRPAVLNRLQQAATGLRSETPPADQVHVEYPSGVVVADARPQFRWRGVAGASYVVQVYTSALQRVAQSAVLHETEWLLPHDLDRGRDYTWQIQIRRDGQVTHAPRPPDPPARFHILDADAVREIAAAAATGRHFVLAVVEARYGLLAEAERELAASTAEVPANDRERVTKLIQEWRRGK